MPHSLTRFNNLRLLGLKYPTWAGGYDRRVCDTLYCDLEMTFCKVSYGTIV